MITTTKQKQINIKAEIYDHKFLEAKQQTEQYCTPEIAAGLEADGFMIGKPFPFDDSLLDLEQAEQEDLENEPAPEEWLKKMFPEVYA